MRLFIKIIAILLTCSACELNLFTSGDDLPVSLDLEITSTDIETVQDIEADFIVTNTSDEKVTYGFPNSCQHGFILKSEDSVLINSKRYIGCLQVITELTLEPEEAKTYHISLKGMENERLEAGKYKLEAFLQIEQRPKVSTSFVVE